VSNPGKGKTNQQGKTFSIRKGGGKTGTLLAWGGGRERDQPKKEEKSSGIKRGKGNQLIMQEKGPRPLQTGTSFHLPFRSKRGKIQCCKGEGRCPERPQIKVGEKRIEGTLRLLF